MSRGAAVKTSCPGVLATAAKRHANSRRPDKQPSRGPRGSDSVLSADRTSMLGFGAVRQHANPGLYAAPHQPHNQQHDQDEPQPATDAVTATTAVIAAAVVPEAAAKQKNHQDDQQK